MRQRGVYEKVQDSGVWWVRYTDAQGRYRREKAGTKSTAIDLYRKRKTEALEGKKLPEKLRQRAVTFREIAEDALAWSDAHKRSAGDDHIRMEKLLAWFGDKPADSLSAQEVEQRFRGERWKPATWNRYRALVSLIYRLATRHGPDGRGPKVKENLARQVSHKTEDNERDRCLTLEEEKKLRAAILEKFPERLPEFELALHTGMRLSEQYDASWQDVNLERCTIRVVVYKGKKPRTTYVKLNDAALSALARLRECTLKTGYVCGGPRSERKRAPSWFEAALGAAAIPNFTWHCLRHTFASRLVMAGADLRTVAELLRDRTLHMVMRYSHLAPDFTLDAVRRMEAVFQNATDTTTDTSALVRLEREVAHVN